MTKTTKLVSPEKWVEAFLEHHAKEPHQVEHHICSLCGDDIEEGDGTDDDGFGETHWWCGQNADGGDRYGKD